MASRYLLCALFITVLSTASAPGQAMRADVIVYGGTPGGVACAVSAARAGRSVIIVEPQVRVGGMISGGLCKTDMGNRGTVGGLSAEFFDRCKRYYQEKYGPDSAQARDSHNGAFMEPSVAEMLFNQMLAEQKSIRVLLEHRLDKVSMNGGEIRGITIRDLRADRTIEVSGSVYVDAGYEGDLMARCGVPYRVGREARGEYGESYAGIQFAFSSAKHPLTRIAGQGDHRPQAYNIRGTLTNRADLRVPFPKPKNYDPETYAGLKKAAIARNAARLEDVMSFMPGQRLPNGKFDPNVADLPGTNFTYPDGDAQTRMRVYERVRDHWLGTFYTLQSDPELPEALRKDMENWGLPKDEYPENGHITPQLYVREARRMIGQYVITQNDVRLTRSKPDGICLGSYNMDSHDVQEVLTPGGVVKEGFLIYGTDPYEIPYRSIVPEDVPNLIVTCAVSATHVAYGSLRMEPVFMMIGQAAGNAADLAIAGKSSVQKIDIDKLRKRQRDAGVPLDAPYRPAVAIRVVTEKPAVGEPVSFELTEIDVRKPLTEVLWNFDGTGEVQARGPKVNFTFKTSRTQHVIAVARDVDGKSTYLSFVDVVTGKKDPEVIDVDYVAAEPKGDWQRHHAGAPFDYRAYLGDNNLGKGSKRLRFVPDLPREGRYIVSFAYPTSSAQAAAVPVLIHSADGDRAMKLNQKKDDVPLVFVPLGEFRFAAGRDGFVEVSNEGTEGIVAADTVRWTWVGE